MERIRVARRTHRACGVGSHRAASGERSGTGRRRPARALLASLRHRRALRAAQASASDDEGAGEIDAGDDGALSSFDEDDGEDDVYTGPGDMDGGFLLEQELAATLFQDDDDDVDEDVDDAYGDGAMPVEVASEDGTAEPASIIAQDDDYGSEIPQEGGELLDPSDWRSIRMLSEANAADGGGLSEASLPDDGYDDVELDDVDFTQALLDAIHDEGAALNFLEDAAKEVSDYEALQASVALMEKAAQFGSSTLGRKKKSAKKSLPFDAIDAIDAEGLGIDRAGGEDEAQSGAPRRVVSAQKPTAQRMRDTNDCTSACLCPCVHPILNAFA